MHFDSIMHDKIIFISRHVVVARVTVCVEILVCVVLTRGSNHASFMFDHRLLGK